jgi:tetratricopeptide (TPR) repeat protein
MLTRPQVFVLVAGAAIGVGLWLQPIGILRNAGKPGSAATATRDAGSGSGRVAVPGAVAATPDAASPGGGAAEHGSAAAEINSAAEAPHRTLAPADAQAILKLRAAFRAETRPASRAGRAAELAEKLTQTQQFDSAGYYYELAAAARPGEKYLQLAADQYFEAFGFAATPQRGTALSRKAQDLYQQVLKANPTNLRAKTNLAMTYVASPQPMQGIFLLREVLAADPVNELALYNLGMLSLQSGQTEKAVGRFEELVKAHPRNLNGHFYLGVALAKTDQPGPARAAFERLLSLSPDPQLRASVEQEMAKLPK